MIDQATHIRATSSNDRRLDRRTVFGGTAAVAAAGLTTRIGAPIKAAAQEATPAAEGDRATFVLVPGQWTGAFVWHKVAHCCGRLGMTLTP